MFVPKMSRAIGLAAIVLLAGAGAMVAWRFGATDRAEELHYQRGESELVVTNLAHARLLLFRAGSSLEEAREIGGFQRPVPLGDRLNPDAMLKLLTVLASPIASLAGGLSGVIFDQQNLNWF